MDVHVHNVSISVFHLKGGGAVGYSPPPPPKKKILHIKVVKILTYMQV